MHGSSIALSLLALIGCLFCASMAQGAVRLNSLFSDHAVLQAGDKVPVWGTAAPGEKVSVTFGGQTLDTTADASGNWRIDLNNLKPGGPNQMTVRGTNTLTVDDILVGEVWLASGQSNMEVTVPGALDPEKELAAANHPQIRIYTVAQHVAAEPVADANSRWIVCTPAAAKNFSAVAYFFARDIQDKIHQPVGMIVSCVGGTWAESWTSTDALKTSPILRPILDHFKTLQDEYRQHPDDAAAKQQEWEAAAAEARIAHRPAPPRPVIAPDPSTQTFRPGGLFNGMIAPLIPYGMRGVIWWQGEYNGPRGEQYRTLFPALIEDWRTRWGGYFSFYFVMLESFDIPKGDQAHYDELREAQLFTAQTVQNTGMAVGVDLGEPHNLHPIRKQEFARRLALLALRNDYNFTDVECYGPTFESMKIDGDKAILQFNHLGGGLVLKPEAQQRPHDYVPPGQTPTPQQESGPQIPTWQLAGADKVFHPAQAEIVGDTIELTAADVPHPVAARYAFSDNPSMLLYNKADLPAPPFRTDHWTMQTRGKLY